MTRVLMTADTVGAMWTYACEVIAALGRYDVEVTLATMGVAPTPEQRRTIERLPNADLETSTFALEWMPDPWRDVDGAGEWLLELDCAGRYDVIQIAGFAHASLPFSGPVVGIAHGISPASNPDEYRRRIADGLRSAAAVVAPTHEILRDLVTTYGLSSDAGAVIPPRMAASYVELYTQLTARRSMEVCA